MPYGRPKIRVVDKARRTRQGLYGEVYVFDSGMEADRFDEIKLQVRVREVAHYVVHPKFQLGEDHTYTADFLVVLTDGKCRVEEIKGGAWAANRRGWRMTMRLWEKYGPWPLLLLIREGRKGWIRTIIERIEE